MTDSEARRLTEYLNEILEDEQLSVADMFDALASTGLKVVPDPDGNSTLDYYATLSLPSCHICGRPDGRHKQDCTA